MHKNFSRICISTLLGIALLTALMILLQTNALLWTAYIWSIWSLIVFAIAMGFWATGSKLKYVLFASYPMVVRTYLISTLSVALFFSILSHAGILTIDWRWFCLIEFAVLAVSAWKLQAMDTGKDAILSTEDVVKMSTVDWKMLIMDISAIAEKSAAADRKVVNRTMEALRFADPVSNTAVAEIEENIKNKILKLDEFTDAGDSEKIAGTCVAIERLIKERADKLMFSK